LELIESSFFASLRLCEKNLIPESFSMKKIPLGKTGIEVSELCFGTLILGHLQANLTPREGALAIHKALELGVNFIDTAKGYKTYPHTRLGIEGFRDTVISSKSFAATAKEMREDVETCLRELGRETIDIFHLHLIKTLADMREREGALDALVRCREEGKIRAVGLSAHGPDGVLASLAYDEIEVVFPVMNRKGLGIIGGTRDEMIMAVSRARNRGLGAYAMKPLGGGHLIDDIPGAIASIRELGLFDSISVGIKTPDEAEIMAGVFENDPAAIARSLAEGKERAGKKRLIVYDFCVRCGKCVESCAQGALSLGEKKAQVDSERCILCGYCAAACPNFVIRVV
jgi:aryl-alcohol dehydrogenase-like predicted oxidoreductase/NAD-dependent dihydropyrimidine dehydrogenase PreA subunit